MKLTIWAVTVGVLALPAALEARDKGGVTPAVVEAVSACRAVTDNDARLRCYDAAVSRLQAAVAEKRVYVLDSAQVQATRQALFGLPLPRAASGGGDLDVVRVDQVDSELTGAVQAIGGQWVFTLANGSVWQQTDDYAFGHTPRRGDKITVRRSTLGSFKATVAGQAPVRVRRTS